MGTISLTVLMATACGSDNPTDRPDSAPANAAPGAGTATSRPSDNRSADAATTAEQVANPTAAGSSNANNPADDEPTASRPATPTAKPTPEPTLTPTPTIVPTPTKDPHADVMMLLRGVNSDGGPIPPHSQEGITTAAWNAIVQTLNPPMVDMLFENHIETYGFYNKGQVWVEVGNQIRENIEFELQSSTPNEITVLIRSAFEHKPKNGPPIEYRISATGVVLTVEPSEDDATTRKYVGKYGRVPKFSHLIDGPVIEAREPAGK